MIKRYGKFVRKTVKEFMESLMKGEIQAYLEENNGSRNGYYERDLGTRYGKINDLRIPRDRDNEFQTALFEKYQRNVGIDDLVVSMYSKGVSTRNDLSPLLSVLCIFILDRMRRASLTLYFLYIMLIMWK